MTCNHVRLSRTFTAIANDPADPEALTVTVRMFCKDCLIQYPPVVGVVRPIDGTDAMLCVHRGELLEMDKCDLCGIRGQPVEVLSCAVYGKCTVFKRKRSLPSCVACPDRKPPE